MTPARPVRSFGDSAVQVEASSMHDAHGLAGAITLQQWPGVEEVVVGYRAVTVIADPAQVQLYELADTAARLAPAPPRELSPRTIEIPVAFDGADLEEVAQLTGMATASICEAMVGAELVVAMVGFVPGFGYLAGLPEPLASVPRRPTPRARVDVGAVALGGGYAGIYPVSSPGGWQLVGRTATRLFDRDSPPYAVLRPGDRVQLRTVTVVEIEAEQPRSRLRAGAGVASVTVLSPGTLSTVQDGGRIGSAALGVPRAGAADGLSARLANRAAGNLASAAALEMTLQGASLRFEASRCIALVGDAELAVDGRPMAQGTVHPVAAGQIVEVGPIGPRPRAYLAIAGGIETPVEFRSRSSDLLCGIGLGPLVAGDELGIGEPGRARGRFEPFERSTTLRVLRGPDLAGEGAWARVQAASFEVGGQSDRTGVRLVPKAPLPAPRPVAGSVGMVTGAVQMPPDGDLIVLGVDHATLGGYPVVAVVASADLPRLGQLRPGDGVRLEAVDEPGAALLRGEREASLSRHLHGWYPVQAG